MTADEHRARGDAYLKLMALSIKTGDLNTARKVWDEFREDHKNRPDDVVDEMERSKGINGET